LYNNFTLGRKYLSYYLKASNGKGHGMHSPFVYRFILNVLNNKQGYKPPAAIEEIRTELLKDQDLLTIEDLGAGSRMSSSKTVPVSTIASRAIKPAKYAAMLYRLARYYQPSTIIELGTSLGITTSYLAKAVPYSKIVTVEGSHAVREKALKVFDQLEIKNIESLEGDFNVLLPSILEKTGKVDLGYIDGNHRLEPTLNYFQQLVDKSHNDTVLIFDDICWSFEMETAWKTIKEHPSVRCTIDTFFLGFVFFRKEFKEPRHFQVRF
jgi:predicted O-methyltransferase YrrM